MTLQLMQRIVTRSTQAFGGLRDGRESCGISAHEMRERFGRIAAW
jgi:hypothetical protein